MKQFIAAALLALIIGTPSFMAYRLVTMDPETLILCVENESGIVIPSDVCEYYMLNYRDIKKDVADLSTRAGLNFIIGTTSPKKYELAQMFIANGIDVNKVSSQDNFPPIFAAVVNNDVQMAELLVQNGADLAVRGQVSQMTPLEFTQFLQSRDTAVDRSAMIQLLSR